MPRRLRIGYASNSLTLAASTGAFTLAAADTGTPQSPLIPFSEVWPDNTADGAPVTLPWVSIGGTAYQCGSGNPNRMAISNDPYFNDPFAGSVLRNAGEADVSILCSIFFAGAGNKQGIQFRSSASYKQDGCVIILTGSGEGSRFKYIEYVGGVVNNIVYGTNAWPSPIEPVILLTCRGNAINFYINDALELSATATANQSRTWVGFTSEQIGYSKYGGFHVESYSANRVMAADRGVFPVKGNKAILDWSAVVEPPDGVVAPFENGMNTSSLFYYDPMPIFVDLLKQGIGMYVPGTLDHVPVDANGWPNGDFLFGTQALPPDSDPSQTITIMVDGNPGTATLTLANGWTKGATVYDSGTDTATIQMTSPSSGSAIQFQMTFTGTKKTPASAVGSGVRRIRIPRPGYGPGYAKSADQVIADEFKSIFQFDTIRLMKSMGAETNYTIFTWDDYPKRNQYWGHSWGGDPADHGGAQGNVIFGPTTMPIEDIVAVANECHVNLWVTMNHTALRGQGTNALEYGMAQYLEANVDPDLHIYYEFGNETWNINYSNWSFANNQGHIEIHGFWFDNYQRSQIRAIAIQRVSNVATITLNYDHGMSGDQAQYKAYWQGRGNDENTSVVAHPTGLRTFTIPDSGPDCKFDCQLIGLFDAPHASRSGGIVTTFSYYDHGFTTGDVVFVPLVPYDAVQHPEGLTSATRIYTITVTDPKGYTFADAGPDGGIRVTNGNNNWGGSLSTGSFLTFDGDVGGSQYFGEKFYVRRGTEMGDAIRTAVGDAKFMTRHRPVYMSQWSSGSLFRFAQWLPPMLTALGKTLKGSYYAIGGGGYPQGTQNDCTRPINDTDHAYTMEQFITEYQESTTTANCPDKGDGGVAFFTPDLFSIYARSQGVKSIAYEIGVDCRIYTYGPYRSANAIQMRLAVSDPRWKQIEANLPQQLVQNGLSGAMFFAGGMESVNLAQGQGYWQLSWGIKSKSPKEQMHNEWQANKPVMTKNVVPGDVDLRISQGYYNGVPSDWPYNTMQSPPGQYPLTGDRWRYVVNSEQAGVMNWVLTYKILNSAAHTVTLTIDDAVIGTFNVTTGTPGTIRTSNALSAAISLGPNAVTLVRDGANADFELQVLSINP